MIPGTDWAEKIPVEQVPAALSKLAALQSALSARLLAAAIAKPKATAPDEVLIDAKEMARRVDCPETWIRTAARQGRIPCVMVGRYVRFKPADVHEAIARGA